MQVVAVGSEPNVLVASLLLARAGHRVSLLTGPVFGGMASLLGNAPFDSELAQHIGLALPAKREGRLGQAPDGRRVILRPDGLSGEVSAADQERWPNFVRLMDDASSLWRALWRQPWGEVADGWRALGRGHAMDVLRMPWHNLKDFLDEWFESDLLKATLAAAALKGSRQGPFACGTVFLLIQRWARDEVLAAAPAPLQALSDLLNHETVTLLDDSASRFQVQEGKVQVVHTDAGRSLEADWVISGEDPITTLSRRLRLFEVDPELVDLLQAWKVHSTTGTVRVDASEFAEFGVVSFVSDVDALERAYDPTKYDRGSETPFAELETGASRLWVQHLVGESAGEGTARCVTDCGLQGAFEPLSPSDIERRYDVSGGHLLGGEPTLWQSHGLRDAFLNPLPNLHLCGSSTGRGDYSGLSGQRCAQRLLSSAPISR